MRRRRSHPSVRNRAVLALAVASLAAGALIPATAVADVPGTSVTYTSDADFAQKARRMLVQDIAPGDVVLGLGSTGGMSRGLRGALGGVATVPARC